MPLVIVYGVPHRLQNTTALSNFAHRDLPLAAASVPGMELSPELVTVLVPGDLVQRGLGTEIIVHVVGVFVREARTARVRREFAQALRDCVVKFAQENVPICEMVEVITTSHRPDDGFADWRRGRRN